MSFTTAVAVLAVAMLPISIYGAVLADKRNILVEHQVSAWVLPCAVLGALWLIFG